LLHFSIFRDGQLALWPTALFRFPGRQTNPGLEVLERFTGFKNEFGDQLFVSRMITILEIGATYMINVAW